MHEAKSQEQRSTSSLRRRTKRANRKLALTQVISDLLLLIADNQPTLFGLALSQISRFTRHTKAHLKEHLRIREEELRKANALISERNHMIKQWSDYCEERATQHQSSIQHREEHITTLGHQVTKLKQENAALLSSISKSHSTMGPVNAEAYYVDEFDSLNHLIQSSVAGMFKRSSNVELSSDAISKIRTLLASISPYGTRTLEILDSHHMEIATFHKSALLRMALVRHLIALVLWDKVLHLFAFGLDVAADKNLREIENQLLSGNPAISMSDPTRTGHRKGSNDTPSIGSGRIAAS